MYKINITPIFEKWLTRLKDRKAKNAIIERLVRIESVGHFGDHKRLTENLYEMRLFVGPGYRVYYTFKQEEIVLLLAGGDKKTQSKDIEKAQELLKLLNTEV